MSRHWMVPPEAEELSAVARAWGLPRIVTQLLLNRGLVPEGDPTGFVSPRLADLFPPESLAGSQDSASMVMRAARESRKIVLYGDYDVDGTTGVAILWHMLRHVGAAVTYYVPHRVEEGYGLNMEAAERLIADGTDVVVTVDCGISSVDVAERFRQAGVLLVVTDHHALHGHLPDAAAIVHPQIGGGYPNPGLCGSGVAFKLAWAIAQQADGASRVSPCSRALLMELLPLAALATIADGVPLTGENRIIARHGLEKLRNSAIPGLRVLMESVGAGAAAVSGRDVAFKLAPRINAAGRMGHARLAVELFTSADESRAREIGLYLEEHNRERQSVERKILREAVERVETEGLAGHARRAIVLASSEWHTGVIGIVAARVVQRFHRPAVLIAIHNGVGQGSARSIPAFDVGDALACCEDHLISHGGHAMAAGLRIAPDRIDAFTDALVSVANNRLTGTDIAPRLRLDGAVGLHEITLPVVETINRLEPFGVGNPPPRFASDWLELTDEPRAVGARGEHLQASFRQNGTRMKAIGFGKSSVIEDLKQHRRCRLAFEPLINEFNGRRTVEMRVIDFQFPHERGA